MTQLSEVNACFSLKTKFLYEIFVLISEYFLGWRFSTVSLYPKIRLHLSDTQLIDLLDDFSFKQKYYFPKRKSPLSPQEEALEMCRSVGGAIIPQDRFYTAQKFFLHLEFVEKAFQLLPLSSEDILKVFQERRNSFYWQEEQNRKELYSSEADLFLSLCRMQVNWHIVYQSIGV
jgi:hypothetical protein